MRILYVELLYYLLAPFCLQFRPNHVRSVRERWLLFLTKIPHWITLAAFFPGLLVHRGTTESESTTGAIRNTDTIMQAQHLTNYHSAIIIPLYCCCASASWFASVLSCFSFVLFSTISVVAIYQTFFFYVYTWRNSRLSTIQPSITYMDLLLRFFLISLNCDKKPNTVYLLVFRRCYCFSVPTVG